MEENIRDQVIFGLKSDIIRQRLLSEKVLNYAKAVEIFLNVKAAEVNTHIIEATTFSEATLSSINEMDPNGFRKVPEGRNRCFPFGGMPQVHISLVCQKHQRQKQLSNKVKKLAVSSHMIEILVDDSGESTQKLYVQTQSTYEKPVTVSLIINDVFVNMQINLRISEYTTVIRSVKLQMYFYLTACCFARGRRVFNSLVLNFS